MFVWFSEKIKKMLIFFYCSILICFQNYVFDENFLNFCVDNVSIDGYDSISLGKEKTSKIVYDMKSLSMMLNNK